LKNFDEFNFEKSNKELQETIDVCEIKGQDRVHLMAKIKKELGRKNISLDFLEL